MEVLRKKEVVIARSFFSYLSSYFSSPSIKVRLTGVNPGRPFIIENRESYIPRYDILLGCASCNRCHTYPHHRISKPDSDTAQKWPTKGGPFSPSFPGLLIALRKPCQDTISFPAPKDSVFITLSGRRARLAR